MDDWQPVEIAPSDMGLVWVWRHGWSAPYLDRANGKVWREKRPAHYDYRYPTHWMVPVPPQPPQN